MTERKKRRHWPGEVQTNAGCDYPHNFYVGINMMRCRHECRSGIGIVHVASLPTPRDYMRAPPSKLIALGLCACGWIGWFDVWGWKEFEAVDMDGMEEDAGELTAALEA